MLLVFRTGFEDTKRDSKAVFYKIRKLFGAGKRESKDS